MEGMQDLAHFRSNFKQIAARLATRGNAPSLDKCRELDQRRRSAITQAEPLEARVNARSSEIGKRRKAGVDTSGLQEQVRAFARKVAWLGPIRAVFTKNDRWAMMDRIQWAKNHLAIMAVLGVKR